MSAEKADRRSEPLVRPPSLRTGDERSASRLELFFDLAYVLVVAELAVAFLEDLTWHGARVFAGLFVVIWLSWVGFTLYANRFDTDDVVFRIAKLVATLAIAGCAASATEATGSLAWAFAASYLAARITLLLLYLRALRHVEEARGTIGVYLAALGLGAGLWVVSIALDSPWREAAWALAVLLDLAAPVIATHYGSSLTLHLEHLPERFGLLVILVLGEIVGGAVIGVHDTKWAAPSLVVALLGFVVAAGLWWNYFDVGAASGAEDLQQEEERDKAQQGDSDADERHDFYIYGHLPLTLGIALAGVGLEDLVLHPSAPVPSAGSWVLVLGVALFFVGAAVIVAGADRRLQTAWPWPTLVVPLIAGAGFAGFGLAAPALALVAALVVAAAVFGTSARRGANAL